MVRRLNAPYFGKRYIGSSETKILHDMDRETPKCKIDAIARKDIQMFEWLSIPLDMDYKGCAYCMADYKEGKLPK
jgi:hypothetical protein